MWDITVGKALKMGLLGRGFHALIKGVSFSSLADVGYHSWEGFENGSARERFPCPYKGCFVFLPNRLGYHSWEGFELNAIVSIHH